MTDSSILSSRPEPAALSVSSWAFTYRFFLSACFLVLILFSLTFRHSGVGIFILGLMDFVFCADILVRSAGKDLLAGRLSFALLLTVCAGAGFLYSAFNTFLTVKLFGPATDLFLYSVLLVTLGLWAERRLTREKEKARVFIKKIDDFLPKSARLCVGRQFRKLFANELKKGDLIFIKPGERLPADGIVRQGKTSIDEQLITGNMLPTSKNIGSRVYAGTLNKSADIYVEVTEILAESSLMSVIDAIKKGELLRSKFKSALDAFAAWLLPLLLVAAGGVYAWVLHQYGHAQWFHYLGIFLFILAVACPAALVFVAVFPSFFTRLGARTQKVKIQNMYALQELAEADTVFFDKTGTLTYGELRVSGVYPAKKISEKFLLETIASAEQLVDGPFAEAIELYAKKRKIKIQPLLCFDVLPGLGVQATCAGEKILAGRTQWLEEQGIKTAAKAATVAEAVVCVARNGKFLGYLTLADELRPGARESVALLKEMGKDIILISGDNEFSVEVIAREAGIEKMNFNVLPKTKAEIVANLREAGKKVVMVGDGFNDIIALLKADAGIVFSSGRNVYNNWVDIIIKRRDLFPISYLFTINKKLRRVVGWNVVLAVLLNGLLAAWLLWRMPQPSAWPLLVGGSLATVLIVFLNSTRMLKIK